MGIVGASSTAMGLAAGSGILALATTFGTASTGTAIATLHGAVATNAALAWLGGGAVSAGGGGMAVGGAVLTGGVIVVAAVAGYGIYETFTYFDERADLRRIELTLSRLSRKTEFLAVGTPVGGFPRTMIKNP